MFLRGVLEADSLPVLERVLSFTEARHKVLAQNVANAETPGWRREDLPVAAFRRELERALARRARRPGRFEMRPFDSTPHTGRVARAHGGVLRHDGTTVDLDREMALVGRNALLHNSVAALLRRKYGALRAAAEGRGTGS